MTEHVNKAVAARKKWAKFGEEEGNKPGPDLSTTTIGENIPLKLGSNTGKVSTKRRLDTRMIIRHSPIIITFFFVFLLLLLRITRMRMKLRPKKHKNKCVGRLKQRTSCAVFVKANISQQSAPTRIRCRHWTRSPTRSSPSNSTLVSGIQELSHGLCIFACFACD